MPRFELSAKQSVIVQKSKILASRTRLEDMLSVMWFPRLFEEAETDVIVGGLLI